MRRPSFHRLYITFGLLLLAAFCGLGANLLQSPLTVSMGHNSLERQPTGDDRIIFRSDRDDNLEIYVIDVNGANETNLSHNGSYDSFPAWSPDGTKIAFDALRDDNWEIYVMNADGSNPINLTNNLFADQVPLGLLTGQRLRFK